MTLVHDAGPDEVQQYHTECLALDPNDRDKLYWSSGKDWSTGVPAICRSSDRGESWQRTTLKNAEGKNVYLTNDRTGERLRVDPNDGEVLWYGSRRDGLFRSPDGGATWTEVTGVRRSWRFGFGMPADGSDGRPVAYLLGRLDGDSAVPEKRVALYRSDDLGASWSRVSDPAAQGWGQATCVAGDRQTPGRVYVGTNGLGIMYGEPAK